MCPMTLKKTCRRYPFCPGANLMSHGLDSPFPDRYTPPKLWPTELASQYFGGNRASAAKFKLGVECRECRRDSRRSEECRFSVDSSVDSSVDFRVDFSKEKSVEEL